MSYLLNFNNWLNESRMISEAAGDPDRVAAPNYFFDYIDKTPGQGTVQYQIGVKGVVEQYTSMHPQLGKQTGTRGKIHPVLGTETKTTDKFIIVDFSIPTSIKGKEAIKNYLETGKGGGNGYYDINLDKSSGEQAYFRTYHPIQPTGQGPTPRKFIEYWKKKKSIIPVQVKDKATGKYTTVNKGVTVDGITNLWELMVAMVAQLHG